MGRGKQIQNQKNKKSKKKPKIMSDIDDNSSKIAITTLSAASAAQNLAVFLKSFSKAFLRYGPNFYHIRTPIYMQRSIVSRNSLRCYHYLEVATMKTTTTKPRRSVTKKQLVR